MQSYVPDSGFPRPPYGDAPYDIHCHSLYSDGTATPEEVVQAAKSAGLLFVALSDHDTAGGVPRAVAEGHRLGIPVLPAAEFDCKFSCLLHILGVDIRLDQPELQQTIASAMAVRRARNHKILSALYGLGLDVWDVAEQEEGVATRLNIALALVRRGYVRSIKDAFDRYLGPGRPAHFECDHLPPEEIIQTIHQAGGLAVMAHPCKLKADVGHTVRRLAAAGLDGVEAYYPTATPGQRMEHCSLARQLGLFVTCGSDYHGANRPGVSLGCAFEPVPELFASRELLLAHHIHRQEKQGTPITITET